MTEVLVAFFSGGLFTTTLAHFLTLSKERRERKIDYLARFLAGIWSDEATFGIELVQVMEEPGRNFWRVVLDGREGMVVSDASDAIQEAIYQKEKKRLSVGWAFPDAAILVVYLKNGCGKDVFDYWDECIFAEVCDTGFVEIWLCNHGSEDAYGTVELIGVKPARWRGVHRHSMYGSKPYG